MWRGGPTRRATLSKSLLNLPLEDALQLVHLSFERGSPKAEPAARRWLVRYLSEGTPSLRDVAKVTASLAKREHERLAETGHGPPGSRSLFR